MTDFATGYQTAITPTADEQAIRNISIGSYPGYGSQPIQYTLPSGRVVQIYSPNDVEQLKGQVDKSINQRGEAYRNSYYDSSGRNSPGTTQINAQGQEVGGKQIISSGQKSDTYTSTINGRTYVTSNKNFLENKYAQSQQQTDRQANFSSVNGREIFIPTGQAAPNASYGVSSQVKTASVSQNTFGAVSVGPPPNFSSISGSEKYVPAPVTRTSVSNASFAPPNFSSLNGQQIYIPKQTSLPNVSFGTPRYGIRSNNNTVGSNSGNNNFLQNPFANSQQDKSVQAYEQRVEGLIQREKNFQNFITNAPQPFLLGATIPKAAKTLTLGFGTPYDQRSFPGQTAELFATKALSLPFNLFVAPINYGEKILAAGEGLTNKASRQNVIQELGAAVPRAVNSFDPRTPEGLSNDILVVATAASYGKSLSNQRAITTTSPTFQGEYFQTEPSPGIVKGFVRGTVEAGGKEVSVVRSYTLQEGNNNIFSGQAKNIVSSAGKPSIVTTEKLSGTVFPNQFSDTTSGVGSVETNILRPGKPPVRDVTSVEQQGFYGGATTRGKPMSTYVGATTPERVVVEFSPTAKRAPTMAEFVTQPVDFLGRQGMKIVNNFPTGGLNKRGQVGIPFGDTDAFGTGGTGVPVPFEPFLPSPPRPMITSPPVRVVPEFFQGQAAQVGRIGVETLTPRTNIGLFASGAALARPESSFGSDMQRRSIYQSLPGPSSVNFGDTFLSPFAIPLQKAGTSPFNPAKSGTVAGPDTSPVPVPGINPIVTPDIIPFIDTITGSDSPSRNKNGSSSQFFNVEFPPETPGFNIPPLPSTPTFGLVGSSSPRGKLASRGFSYAPSLNAELFNIHGKKPKGQLTGYETRPIPNNKWVSQLHIRGKKVRR